MRPARCFVCGVVRDPSDLLAFQGKTTSGFVCRPERWMNERDRDGRVLRRGFVDDPRTGASPCFNSLTTQTIRFAVEPPPYVPLSTEYPIRPGTPAWTELMRESGGSRALAED